MYRHRAPTPTSSENFELPFSGQLSSENRWVKLAEMIPWKEFEPIYAEQFSESQGAPAKSFRVALGSLIIKEKLGTSDQETVEQIRENPYLQYFLGFSSYRNEAPFDPSMMVHFRKRISLEAVAQINERVVDTWLHAAPIESSASAPTDAPASPSAPEPCSPESQPENAETSPTATQGSSHALAQLANAGQLILDATCAPADIRYPTDLSLLNEARLISERIIDALWSQVSDALKSKPRTYRRAARKAFLAIAKKRRPTAKQRRKGIRQQLGYLRRNLAHLDTLLQLGASLSQLSKRLYRSLLVVSEVYRQQQQMYQTKTHRIDDRIVSISQPHVRPIVRGKAGSPVEFGSKLSVSCVNGCVFIDHLSWDNFNESGDLKAQVEAFRHRFGHYPASVHADQIYRTRENLRWCKQLGIRLSGPPLGRPSNDPDIKANVKQQARDDERVRVEIEGKFGVAKRRFSLARVMAKLATTAATTIAITFLVMNLERGLRLRLASFLAFLGGFWRGLQGVLRPFLPWLSNETENSPCEVFCLSQ